MLQTIAFETSPAPRARTPGLVTNYSSWHGHETGKGGVPEQKSASRRSQPEQDFEASLQGHHRQVWWRHIF